MKTIKRWIIRAIFVSFVVSIVPAVLINTFEEKEYIEIEVQPGDSIWSIATEWSKHSDYSSNSMVEWIIKENNKWDTIISPGEFLLIPVEEEEGVQVATEN